MKGTKYPKKKQKKPKIQIIYFIFFQLSTLNNSPFEGRSDMKLKEAKMKIATRPDKKKNVFLKPNDLKEPSKRWGITMEKMELPETTIPLTFPMCLLK